MSLFSFLPILNLLVLAMLASIVLWKNPGSVVSRSFGMGILSLIIVELGHFFTLLTTDGNGVLFAFKIALMGICLFPFT